MLLFFLITAAVGLLFVILMYFKYIPISRLYEFALPFTLLLIAATWYMGITREQLGFVPVTFEAIKVYGIGTIIGLIFLALIIKPLKLKFLKQKLTPRYILGLFLYLVISCPLQEFVFRAYLFGALSRLSFDLGINSIFLGAFIFALSHAPLRNTRLTLGSAVTGLILSTLYFISLNFWLVSVVHFIFGVAGDRFGLIAYEGRRRLS
ncbi:MAG: hypothetical protein Fur003_4290 [Candidatus Dojkabacteria bacterium]